MRPYLPGILALFFGFLCARFPGIAVFLVSGAAFFFGIVYTMVVYKIQKARKATESAGGYSYDANSNTWSSSQDGRSNGFKGTVVNMEEPSFRNVTTFMFREGRWIKQDGQ